MRDSTGGKYPRFAVWENVPGVFSSNSGRDFKTVLEAFCAIGGYSIPLPEPPGGKGRIKWLNAGSIMGDGFSIAWRV
jgi:DNA (cytosine-5)-methyltransferase 1